MRQTEMRQTEMRQAEVRQAEVRQAEVRQGDMADGLKETAATPRHFVWHGEMGDEMCAAFAEDGYLIIEDFFAADQCDALKAHAIGLMDNHQADEDLVVFSAAGQAHAKADYFRTSGDKIRFFLEEGAVDEAGQLRVPMREAVNKIGHNLHDLDSEFSAFSRAPQMRKVAEKLFTAPQLLQSMYICKNAHIGGEVNCHQDSTFLYTEPESCIGFWVALEDATPENGCLYAETGGHHGPLRALFQGGQENGFQDKGGELAMRTLDTTPFGEADAALIARKGTLVLLHGRVPHRSSANMSDKSRHAYALHVIDGSAHYPAENWLQRGADHPLRGFETEGLTGG